MGPARSGRKIEDPTLLRLKELESPERVAEKVEKIPVYDGLEGVMKNMVRIAP
jgi:hypothetical protein